MSSDVQESEPQSDLQTGQPPARGILFVVSSPSGGGKGTLINRVLNTVPGVSYSVSYTTRAPRDGEVNGRDYFFVSPDKFEAMISGNEKDHAASGHWGVPTFVFEKEPFFGQDRIDLLIWRMESKGLTRRK